MTHYDPAKQPCDPKYYPCGDCPTCIAGPGGSSINTENNEKGILEATVFASMVGMKMSELGSNHDPMRQGIYRTNSMGDSD